MLHVEIKVNRDKIGELKIRNLGRGESYAKGLTGTERLYVYEVFMNENKVEGEIIHDRSEGALVLIRKVIEDLEGRGNLIGLNKQDEGIKEKILKMVGMLEK